jgi:hypothetical protein
VTANLCSIPQTPPIPDYLQEESNENYVSIDISDYETSITSASECKAFQYEIQMGCALNGYVYDFSRITTNTVERIDYPSGIKDTQGANN